jgi:hypothetical protein
MIGPGKPEGIETLHPPPARDDVRKGKAEGMAHMKRSCDIRRRKNHRKSFPRRGGFRCKQPLLDPEIGPFDLHRMRIIGFLQDPFFLHLSLPISEPS